MKDFFRRIWESRIFTAYNVFCVIFILLVFIASAIAFAFGSHEDSQIMVIVVLIMTDFLLIGLNGERTRRIKELNHGISETIEYIKELEKKIISK
jgi:hypothetical protein